MSRLTVGLRDKGCPTFNTLNSADRRATSISRNTSLNHDRLLLLRLLSSFSQFEHRIHLITC